MAQSLSIVFQDRLLLPADRMFHQPIMNLPHCHPMCSQRFHQTLAAQEPHQAHGKPPWLSLQEKKTTQLWVKSE